MIASIASIAASVVIVGSRASAAEAPEAKKIFMQRCTACHTFGKGVKVGPDLKGVTVRRQRPWLLRFIRSSQSVIQARDPVASALFAEYRQQRMPDWTDLSETQVNGILDWLAVDGPDQKEPDERDAELASAADIERARGLFGGTIGLANGGAACGTCHSIRDNGATIGGSLGPNLTSAYMKYRDRGLTLFLRKPCFRREPESSAQPYLTPDEAFALKAYLRAAALPPGSVAVPAPKPAPPPPDPAPSPPAVENVTPVSFPVRHKHKRGHR